MNDKTDRVIAGAPDDAVTEAYLRYLLAVQAYRERHKLPAVRAPQAPPRACIRQLK